MFVQTNQLHGCLTGANLLLISGSQICICAIQCAFLCDQPPGWFAHLYLYIELYLGQILPLCIIIICVLSKHLLLWFHISLATFICIFVDLHLWEPHDWPRWEIEGGAEEVSTNGRSAARGSRNKTTTNLCPRAFDKTRKTFVGTAPEMADCVKSQSKCFHCCSILIFYWQKVGLLKKTCCDWV